MRFEKTLRVKRRPLSGGGGGAKVGEVLPNESEQLPLTRCPALPSVRPLLSNIDNPLPYVPFYPLCPLPYVPLPSVSFTLCFLYPLFLFPPCFPFTLCAPLPHAPLYPSVPTDLISEKVWQQRTKRRQLPASTESTTTESGRKNGHVASTSPPANFEL